MSEQIDAVSHEQHMRETYARMAGQIAQAFAHLPEADAAAAIANHINRYWGRSMRRDLGRLFSRQSPELHPAVRRAWDTIHLVVG